MGGQHKRDEDRERQARQHKQRAKRCRANASAGYGRGGRSANMLRRELRHNVESFSKTMFESFALLFVF
jgi:hypothetical protein